MSTLQTSLYLVAITLWPPLTTWLPGVVMGR